jgi:hypothetical protein
VSASRRDGLDAEALITDRYLDSLIAGAESGDADPVTAAGAVDAAVRLASRRLARDFPRFHPSFRFEERLALRLAEVAATLRLPAAAGAEGAIVPFAPGGRDGLAADPLRVDPDWPGATDGFNADPLGARIGRNRPLIIGGALTASALSIAGAALVAWRRSRTDGAPMVRAIRAVNRGRTGRRSSPRMPAVAAVRRPTHRSAG